MASLSLAHFSVCLHEKRQQHSSEREKSIISFLHPFLSLSLARSLSLTAVMLYEATTTTRKATENPQKHELYTQITFFPAACLLRDALCYVPSLSNACMYDVYIKWKIAMLSERSTGINMDG
jgi:hypothetical protein